MRFTMTEKDKKILQAIELLKEALGTKDVEEITGLMDISIENSNLSHRAKACLRGENINNLYQLSKVSIAWLMCTPNVGNITCDEIVNFAKEHKVKLKKY